jgi:hypothetical protein
MHLANLHIASINDLTNKVVVKKHVDLGSLVYVISPLLTPLLSFGVKISTLMVRHKHWANTFNTNIAKIIAEVLGKYIQHKHC